MARYKKDKPDSGMTASITFYKHQDGHVEAYRSGFEARVAGTFDLMGFEGVQHERLNWLDPYAPTPRYLPDFTWRNSDGTLSVAEVKGYFDDHAEEQLATMREYVDDPENDVFCLTLIQSKAKGEEHGKMFFYQHGIEDFLPAGFYKCPSCGKPFVAAHALHSCPRCGEQETIFKTDDPNGWYNNEVSERRIALERVFQEQLNEKREQQIRNSDRNKVLSGKFSVLARAHGMKLTSENLAILSDYAVNQQIVPAFSYPEARRDRKRYGTALSPVAAIYIDADPSSLDRKHYAEIRRYVDDRKAPLAKVAVITDSGIHVYDSNVPDYEDGAGFQCDKCGGAYISPKSSHDCPFCGSHDNHEFTSTK